MCYVLSQRTLDFSRLLVDAEIPWTICARVGKKESNVCLTTLTVAPFQVRLLSTDLEGVTLLRIMLWNTFSATTCCVICKAKLFRLVFGHQPDVFSWFDSDMVWSYIFSFIWFSFVDFIWLVLLLNCCKSSCDSLDEQQTEKSNK